MVSYTDLQPVNCKIRISSFLHGAARLFDFAQVLDQPGTKTSTEVDVESLRRDWETIGRDMGNAMKQVKMELAIDK